MSDPARLDRTEARSFRTKLLVSIMLVVCGITGLSLYVVQHNARAGVQAALQREFQGQLSFLHGVQEVRRAVIAERCQLLAKSVRIRAAFEEDSVEDLYRTAEVELRDVLSHDAPPESGDTPPVSLHASFYRFLNASGQVMSPESLPDLSKVGTLEERLATPPDALDDQEIGYLTVRTSGGDESLLEIIETPIITTDMGAVIGSLVLGFKPVELGAKVSNGGMRSGVWTDGKLHMPGISDSAKENLGAIVAGAVRTAAGEEESHVVNVDGVPHLLFHKILNPSARFAPAYHVCIYPLTEALERQRKLTWNILGAGASLLIVGLMASHVVSGRFSKPVERLAKDSAHQAAQREQAEAALELSEQKYRGVFENAVEGIFILGSDGCFLSVNPALVRTFGFDSSEELIGKSLRPLCIEPDQFENFLHDAQRNGGIVELETAMLRKDGDKIWVSQNARAVRAPNGKVLHVEGTFVDVTTRKRAGDELLALNSELQAALGTLKTTQRQVIQQERLRALGQMASGIAHDFNNALVPILGFCELLLLSPAVLADREKATRYLETIQTAAKDATSVVSRLREFYRGDKGDTPFEPVNLKRLSEQAVTLTRPKWKDQAQASGVTIQIVLELEPVPPIAGDESALREALTNLIFNAVDAMPDGGTITLRTHREGDSAIMEIADTGSGMTDEVRRRCLEPFFSTKGERGTGLGLSMVFGIIQRHSGTLDLQSEIGKGTTFIIKLPLQDAANLRHTSVAPVEVSRTALRILVVDDEAPVRDTLTAVLAADGHDVESAMDGAEGLRRFLGSKYDLVITDKAMPGMSGDQMAKAIKQSSPKTPIVLLTGFGLFLDKKDFPAVDALASKPVRIPQLREAITNALGAV